MPSTPRRLPSGSWNCYAYLGKDAEGKRIQRSVTRPTKAEARAAAVELEQSAPAPENPAASEMTLAQATEDYVRSRANVFSPSTARSYRSICRNYFGPLAGDPIFEQQLSGNSWYLRGLPGAAAARNAVMSADTLEDLGRVIQGL